MTIVYLNIRELRDLHGGERDLLEDTAKRIEGILRNASNIALASRLDLNLTQRGLITTLAMTTARFAAASNKSQDEGALGSAITRCMAYALFYVLAFSGEDFEEAPLVGWRRREGADLRGDTKDVS
jgi:hypothetical protein